MASNVSSLVCEWDGCDLCHEPNCECKKIDCWHRGVRPALTERSADLDREIEVVRLVMATPIGD